ncbi:MAG: dihydrodipicolinate synthase family protein [Acetobacteraceae bacterium]|nr:dihydrodipicolinate synthase family protein [Acetobacteraceae bacterium]MCX7683716.1 dihydrodipicolinate synthase family protein [Acetobacteraceae bacterium]MDW8398612.1 dihydrodipicolinate synthase family protein [Acetobacteraceae bacterium]
MQEARLRRALAGVVGVLVTPYDETGRIAPDRLGAVVRRAIAAGVGALTVNGNTGEFFSLSLEEAEEMCTALARIAAGRTVLVAGVGRSATEAARLARQAARAGADALMIHQPLDPFRGPSGFVRYVEEVLAAAPSLPAVLYLREDPGAEALARLAALPGIVGAKWAIGDLLALAEARRIAPGWQWVCGLAEPWAPAMSAVGARGFTSGLVNLCPRLSVALSGALAAGRAARAESLLEAVLPFEILRARGRGEANVSVVKAALAARGEALGPARPPALWPLPAGTEKELASALAALEAAEAALQPEDAVVA